MGEAATGGSLGKLLRRGLLILGLATLILAAGLWLFRDRLLRPIGIQVPTGDPAIIQPELPPGFQSSVFAEDLEDPRFMALAPGGLVLVAERGADRLIALPDRDRDGRAEAPIVLAEGLRSPSSLAVLARQDADEPGRASVFVGETDKVRRLEIALRGPFGEETEVLSEQVVVDDLPAGGIHFTRTVLIGSGIEGDAASEPQLYVAIGSSCNVCQEEDERRAAVMAYGLDGSGGHIFARGLRNAVGLATNPWTREIWATNNGRDLMGKDRPPETLYALEEGLDAGWPRCHAGDLPDPGWEGRGDPCVDVAEPLLEMQAHSAPLDLAFYDGRVHQGFPAEYRDDLYIAFHGSWNRVPPTGYSVVRVPLEAGRVAGPAEDFATGWLRPDESVRGRPAGLLVDGQGALLVSDDRAGLIYRIAAEEP